jgi:prephenate dehydrogenase
MARGFSIRRETSNQGDRLSKVHEHSKKRVGVIGGQGRMGAWFAKWFKQHGYTVECSDIGTSVNNHELVTISNIVVVSVPISSTVDVIGEIAPLLSNEQLLLDLTSLKIRPMQAMMKSKAQVLGLHPMFGPSASSITNQKIIVCLGREGDLTQEVLSLLENTGAVLKRVTPEEHDKMMAVIQGLNHFASIVLGKTLKDIGVSVQDSLEFASPVYLLRLDMIGRILAQDAQLYADIEFDNPEVAKVLNVFKENVVDLVNLVGAANKKDFVQVFQDASNHFKDYLDKASSNTDQMIEFYAKLSKRNF